MQNEVEKLLTFIYVYFEIECWKCHRCYEEPEGETEKEILQWAERTAASAYQAGWRIEGRQLFCPECISQKQGEPMGQG